MCGRVRLASDYSEIKIRLRFGSTAPAPNYAPSWNKAPTDPMLVATYAKGGERIAEIMRWGLIPRWAKDIKVGYSTFNARADSVSTKPAFRDAWKRGQRCLVVTDGFYEWRKSDKQPFAIGMTDDGLMVMAGLWDLWISPQGEKIKSCVVITCEANEAVGALHDRMPVILRSRDYDRWLDREPNEQPPLDLLRPFPSDEMEMHPANPAVGNVRNNGPEMLADPQTH